MSKQVFEKPNKSSKIIPSVETTSNVKIQEQLPSDSSISITSASTATNHELLPVKPNEISNNKRKNKAYSELEYQATLYERYRRQLDHAKWKEEQSEYQKLKEYYA